MTRTCSSSGAKLGRRLAISTWLPRALQRVLGAQQQPGAGGVEPVDPAEIERDLPALRQFERVQLAVERGGGRDQPIAVRPQNKRARFVRRRAMVAAGAMSSAEALSEASAAGSTLSNYAKTRYPATTACCMPSHGGRPHMDLKPHIRSIPDFPKPGILFYDISTLLAHPEAWQATVERLAEAMRPHRPELLVGIESRGFLVAAPLAYALGCGFAMVRKKGKLPGKTVALHLRARIRHRHDRDAGRRDRARPARRRRRRSAGDRRHDAGRDRPGDRSRAATVVAAACIIELEFLNGRASSTCPSPRWFPTGSSPMADRLEGGCSCGAVRYRLESAPMSVHCCHCKDCQRQTGAAFAVNALIETDRVTVLSGEPQACPMPTDSGRPHEIYRCPACQIGVWSEYGGLAKLRFVRVGTLDDPDALPPTVHIYTRSKLPWVALPEGVPAFEAYYSARQVWPAESLERREKVIK